MLIRAVSRSIAVALIGLGSPVGATVTVTDPGTSLFRAWVEHGGSFIQVQSKQVPHGVLGTADVSANAVDPDPAENSVGDAAVSGSAEFDGSVLLIEADAYASVATTGSVASPLRAESRVNTATGMGGLATPDRLEFTLSAPTRVSVRAIGVLSAGGDPFRADSTFEAAIRCESCPGPNKPKPLDEFIVQDGPGSRVIDVWFDETLATGDYSFALVVNPVAEGAASATTTASAALRLTLTLTPPSVGECSDDVDNDGDGSTDLEDDGCVDQLDPIEDDPDVLVADTAFDSLLALDPILTEAVPISAGGALTAAVLDVSYDPVAERPVFSAQTSGVFAHNAATGFQELLIDPSTDLGDDFDSADGVAVTPAGEVYAVDPIQGSLVKIEGGLAQTISMGGALNTVTDVVIAPDGSAVFAAMQNGVFKVVLDESDPMFGVRQTLADPVLNPGFSNADGVAVAPTGEVYAIDNVEAAILRIDSQTSTPEVSQGGFLANAFDIAVRDDGMVLAAAGVDGVIVIDPSDGSQTLLSDPIDSPGFSRADSVAVIPEPSVLAGWLSGTALVGLLARTRRASVRRDGTIGPRIY